MGALKNLETDRLILREFKEQDVQAVYKIFSDREVNTFLPMFPLKHVEEAKSYLFKRYLECAGSLDGYRYAICLKETNHPIGYVHVSGDDSHDLGYGLMKEYWHMGIVSEASDAVVKSLSCSGVPYITATHDVNNLRSGEVMKKIGMTYRYSYKEQWQPKDILVTFRMYQLNFTAPDEFVYEKYWNLYQEHFIEERV